MQKKSVDRFKEQSSMDKKLGILADTSRGDKRVMQGYFELKHHEHLEAKRLNKDTDRGINLHMHSAAKFRDGALNLTKEGIRKIEGRDGNNNHHKKQHKKSYEEIKQVRDSNPEYMTGKRFRKKKGGVGKKFSGGKRHKKK